MTAARIYRTAHPSRQNLPLRPMSAEMARFWELRRERAAQKDAKK